MTTIYKFQDSETVVTSTTTSNILTAADPVLIYSQSLDQAGQTTVGHMGSFVKVTAATSATTATNIAAYGLTTLGSSVGPITAWIMDPPKAAGVKKTLFSISTSTAHTVTVTTGVTIKSTPAWAAEVLTFTAPGSWVEMTSISTAAYIVTNYTTTSVLFS